MLQRVLDDGVVPAPLATAAMTGRLTRLIGHLWGLVSAAPIAPARDEPVGCRITYHHTFPAREQRSA